MPDVRDHEEDDDTESRKERSENPLVCDDRKLEPAEEKLEVERCCA